MSAPGDHVNDPFHYDYLNKNVHLVRLHLLSILHRERILTEFYNTFLSVFFPHKDQLTELPVLLDALSKKDGFDSAYNLRVDVLFERGKMIGGIVYEYYQRSGCGLIAYYCVHPEYKGKEYGTLLVRAAEREIHEVALARGLPFANAIFFETNTPNGPLELSEGSVAERYASLDKLGYKHVQFPFVQPPLEANKAPSDTLLLLVSVVPPHKLLKAPNEPEKFALSAALLKEWMIEYWHSVDTEVDVIPEYQRMVAFFDEHKQDRLSLRSLLELSRPKF